MTFGYLFPVVSYVILAAIIFGLLIYYAEKG
jgi:hypothetical protein